MSVAPPFDGPLLDAPVAPTVVPVVTPAATPAATPAIALATARADARAGRVRAAIGLLEPLLRSEPFPGSATDRIVALETVIEAHLALGDLGAAIGWDGVIERVIEGVVGTSDLPHEAAARALYIRGELASAMDQPDLALDRFCAAGAAGADLAVPHVPWRAGATLALVRLGRRREALAHARDHLALVQAHEAGAPALALALRILATAESDGQRVARLVEARRLLADGAAPRLGAQLDTDLAGLLVLDGHPDQALALLREVERFAGAHHLAPLLGRVRRLLERLGEAPRRRESEALAVLTAAERRVALHALDGLSNRDISVSLEISVKAVEGHLSRIYRKLGIASRSALIEAVGVRL